MIKNVLLMYSADLPLSRQRLETGKAAEYTLRIINIYITKSHVINYLYHTAFR